MNMESAITEACRDEIWNVCIKCGKERVTAYWDDELEYYIYLTDEKDEELVCIECQEQD